MGAASNPIGQPLRPLTGAGRRVGEDVRMRFFRFPERRAAITHMSRAAWAVNRIGVLTMAAGAALMLTGFAVPYGIQLPFAFAGYSCALAGMLLWFFAGSPV